LENSIGAEMPMDARARMEMSILNPRMATIQPVNVVPMLAPKITPMDWTKVIRPALTNETTMTVVAEELWINTVMKIPVRTATKRFFVIIFRMFLSLSPAVF
jgi:hypothetical protein